MKQHDILSSLVPLALLAGTMIAPAVPEQIGDLRLDPAAFPDSTYYFDPGWEDLSTREVPGASFQLTSLFSGTSQNPAPGGGGDPALDPGIQTFPDYTEFKNLNRFGMDDDGPLGEVDLNGAQRIGMLQYEIDLTPVESYLGQSGETLTTLNLGFEFLFSDPAKTYDIYLSYTDAGEEIAETLISTDDAEANYTDFWLPARTNDLGEVEIAPVGEVINGTHKILNINEVGNLSQSTDLLPLYNAGVRKVNVIIAVGSFYSGRLLSVEASSGIFVGTDALPTEQVGDLRLAEDLFRTYSHADQFGPLTTRPVPDAAFDVPSVVRVTSQNQGNNPPPGEVAARFGLDGVTGGENTFIGRTATVTGFGLNGIGATASDQYQYTAWSKSGDFTVDVEVTSLTSLEAGARAGLMIRDSLEADAAHAFIGIQQTGEPVVVTRDAAGNVAAETIGTAGALPQWVRIERTGDLFSFSVSADGETYEPASTAEATIVLADPVFAGMAVTSGSDLNDASAVFSNLSATLADQKTDIGLRTFDESTQIKTLNRFASADGDRVGAVQWSLDLTPLEGHLAGNSLTLESLSLALLADPSDDAENKLFDVYLSYTDPEEPIELIGISKVSGESNYLTFWEPADGAFDGDIVNETHKVLLAQGFGDIDLTEDLLPLYEAGVREFNLIIASTAFFSNRNLEILEGSGVFIETSGGAEPVVITDVSRVGNVLSVTVDGLTNGSSYHLGGSTDLSGFPSISGTTVVATGAGDVLSATIPDTAYYVRVLEGAAP